MTDTPTRDETQSPAGLMTIDEFVRLYADEGPFEIIDGERIAVQPMVLGPARAGKRLYDALMKYLDTQPLGELLYETNFILPDKYSPTWVLGARRPDILFIEAGRWAAYLADHPDADSLPLMLVPDLVVEIVSPTDNLNDVDRKIDAYLADGVRVVWQVNPTRRKVSIHVPGSEQQTNLTSGATLTGGDLLPGFQIALAALFGG
jgi:Uma2 family endonuclease